MKWQKGVSSSFSAEGCHIMAAFFYLIRYELAFMLRVLKKCKKLPLFSLTENDFKKKDRQRFGFLKIHFR